LIPSDDVIDGNDNVNTINLIGGKIKPQTFIQ
jgi:hypothetical protein